MTTQRITKSLVDRLKSGPQKTESRPKNSDTVSEKLGQSPPEVSEKFRHMNGHTRPKNPDITSLTTGVARAGSELAGSCEGDAEHADDDAAPPPVSVPSKKRAA